MSSYTLHTINVSNTLKALNCGSDKFSTEPHDPAYGAGINDWLVVSQEQFDELSTYTDADVYENEDGKFILFYTYNKERADREEW